jgi:hypothetical protein
MVMNLPRGECVLTVEIITKRCLRFERQAQAKRSCVALVNRDGAFPGLLYSLPPYASDKELE